MPRTVKGPDGRLHRFPDEATDAQISRALGAVPEINKSQVPQAKTWSDRLGLNQPTDSVLGGFMRGAATGVVDLVQGAAHSVTGQLNEKLDAENIQRKSAGLPQTVTVPRVESPESFSGDVGNVLPTMAEMAIGGAPIARAAKAAIPSTLRAGENFQKVMAAAKNVPIETKSIGDAALRIQQLAERGASMPMSVRKLLLRMTDPNKAAMAYEESRDFASNISRLSVDEMKRLTPVVRREVASLSMELNKANAEAARQAGRLKEYESAMLEYSRAMHLRDLANTAIQGVKKAAPYATLTGAGYWLTKKLGSMID